MFFFENLHFSVVASYSRRLFSSKTWVQGELHLFKIAYSVKQVFFYKNVSMEAFYMSGNPITRKPFFEQ